MAPAAITCGAFLTKISADGSHIVYSTLLSGSFGRLWRGQQLLHGRPLRHRRRSRGGPRPAEAYLAGNTNTNDLPTTPALFSPKGPGAYGRPK